VTITRTLSGGQHRAGGEGGEKAKGATAPNSSHRRPAHRLGGAADTTAAGPTRATSQRHGCEGKKCERWAGGRVSAGGRTVQ
jgi:hypothetical protein